MKGKLPEKEQQTYWSETYSNASGEQVPGSTNSVADLWLRLTTNLANDKLGKPYQKRP